MYINFILNRQRISRTDHNHVVADSRNYLRAHFELLSDDWRAPITAIFGDYKVILDENCECLVPWEALRNPGNVPVSAFCGDLHTAGAARLMVHPSGYTDAEATEPPTPDVYAQLTAIAQTAVETADSVRNDADKGAFNGAPGKDGEDGLTPVKGKDYWTQEDVDEVVDEAAYLTLAQVKNLSFHICTADEVDENGVPTIAEPDSRTFYLVSSGEASPNLFIEWVWINGAWERFGSATIDLSNYVKHTDYATDIVPGLVAVLENYGIKQHPLSHRLQINSATALDIDSKNEGGNPQDYKPIVPKMIDYTVKSGITSNSIPLSAEEQSAAQAWLGGQMVRTIEADENGKYTITPWTAENGYYVIPAGTVVNLSSTSRDTFTNGGILVIYQESTARKGLFALHSAYHTLRYGYVTETTGYLLTLSLGSLIRQDAAQTISGAKTFSVQPKITAELAADDDSTNIPTTQWVHALLADKTVRKIETDENGTLSMNIRSMQEGIYFVPTGCIVQYGPGSVAFTTSFNSYFVITQWSDAITSWMQIGGVKTLTFGDSRDGSGTKQDVAFGNVLTTTNGATIYGVMNFSRQPIMTAELAADDNSTNIPTTQWVNAAIQTALAGLNAKGGDES